LDPNRVLIGWHLFVEVVVCFNDAGLDCLFIVVLVASFYGVARISVDIDVIAKELCYFCSVCFWCWGVVVDLFHVEYVDWSFYLALFRRHIVKGIVDRVDKLVV